MGGLHVIDGKITLGEFVAFIAYLGMLVRATGQPRLLCHQPFQRGAASMERINAVLDEKAGNL